MIAVNQSREHCVPDIFHLHPSVNNTIVIKRSFSIHFYLPGNLAPILRKYARNILMIS